MLYNAAFTRLLFSDTTYWEAPEYSDTSYRLHSTCRASIIRTAARHVLNLFAHSSIICLIVVLLLLIIIIIIVILRIIIIIYDFDNIDVSFKISKKKRGTEFLFTYLIWNSTVIVELYGGRSAPPQFYKNRKYHFLGRICGYLSHLKLNSNSWVIQGCRSPIPYDASLPQFHKNKNYDFLTRIFVCVSHLKFNNNCWVIQGHRFLNP